MRGLVQTASYGTLGGTRPLRLGIEVESAAGCGGIIQCRYADIMSGQSVPLPDSLFRAVRLSSLSTLSAMMAHRQLLRSCDRKAFEAISIALGSASKATRCRRAGTDFAVRPGGERQWASALPFGRNNHI